MFTSIAQAFSVEWHARYLLLAVSFLESSKYLLLAGSYSQGGVATLVFGWRRVCVETNSDCMSEVGSERHKE